MMLLLGSAAQGYGRLEGHEASAAVESACARCSSRLGHALGDPWTSCVVDELLTEQDEAKQAGRPYFPMVPHVYQPLAPERRGYGQADLFKNLLRNCTCNFDDGGSPPLRRQCVGIRPAWMQCMYIAHAAHTQRTRSAHAAHIPLQSDVGVPAGRPLRWRCAAALRALGWLPTSGQRPARRLPRGLRADD